MSETTFVFWDVQHGSSAYIKTPNGKHIVIDLGTGSYGENDTFSPLCYLKDEFNVHQLDGVIITHPHRDHLDDIVNFNALSPKVLRHPKHLSKTEVRNDNQDRDSDVIEKYLEINEKYTEPASPNTNPFLPENNGGVVFQTFYPSACATSNLNNHSSVTIVSYGGLKIIIPGDNENPSWNELLERDDFQQAIEGTDILVASHHGRESGFSTVLFDYISPFVTIISDDSVGPTCVRDRYDQRTQGWLVRKRSNQAMVERRCLTTRNDGVIVVTFGRNRHLGVSIN